MTDETQRDSLYQSYLRHSMLNYNGQLDQIAAIEAELEERRFGVGLRRAAAAAQMITEALADERATHARFRGSHFEGGFLAVSLMTVVDIYGAALWTDDHPGLENVIADAELQFAKALRDLDHIPDGLKAVRVLPGGWYLLQLR